MELTEISYENMDEMLKYFASFEKLSGTQGAELASDYITNKLKQYGIPCEKYVFDGYVSNPVSSRLTVIGKECAIDSRPRAFSKYCPQGIEAELVFDPYSTGSGVDGKERHEFYKSFRNKIVLGYGYDEGYAKRIEKYGAVGLVQIWPGKEEVLHEDTVGTVWGTSGMYDELFYLDIPVISIKHSSGALLRNMLEKEKLSVRLVSVIDTRVCRVSLPVAHIRGKSEEFVLLSGHYDTWYEGVTDNCAGNAACLEAARILAEKSDRLERSVRIAWWPGHSNGRYMGSTWYCDNFWDELYENCAAHIYTDCIGSKGTDAVAVKTTLLEGKDFTGKIVKEITGSYPAEYGSIGRGADQSFWGAGIPIHIMTRHEVSRDKGEKVCPGAGVWWWHTEEDTYDKVDRDILVKDAGILTSMVYELAARKVLPADFSSYFSNARRILEEADESSGEEFDFRDIYHWLEKLRSKTEEIFERKDIGNDVRNRLIRLIGGEMNRLLHSYSGRYGQDSAIFRKPFPHISIVAGIYRGNTPEEEFLFMRTEFLRQRNRLVTEIKRILIEIDNIFMAQDN